MAQKRMFSLHIVDTDKFMDMSTSAQALYFHLGMHGDDDGFVSSPRKIARAAGCNDDDMRLLAMKGFIIPFDSGVVVITDWKVNNTIKADRYSPTIYQKEKGLLQIASTGQYHIGTEADTECIQNGSNVEPQISIDKKSPVKESKADKPPKPVRHKHGEYENVLLTDEEHQKLQAEIPNCADLIDRLSGYIASTGKTYKSHYVTLRNWHRKDKSKVDSVNPMPNYGGEDNWSL